MKIEFKAAAGHAEKGLAWIIERSIDFDEARTVKAEQVSEADRENGSDSYRSDQDRHDGTTLKLLTTETHRILPARSALSSREWVWIHDFCQQTLQVIKFGQITPNLHNNLLIHSMIFYLF